MNTSKSDSRLLLSLAALIAVTGLLVKFTAVPLSQGNNLDELQSSATQRHTVPALPLKLTGTLIVEGTQSLENKRLLDIQLAALVSYAESKHGKVEMAETRYQRSRSPDAQIAPPLSIAQTVRISLPAGNHTEIEAQLRFLGLRQISRDGKGK